MADPQDKSKLAPRELCLAHLVDAAIALKNALPLTDAVASHINFRLPSQCQDALSIVTTMLNEFQHEADVARKEWAARKAERAPAAMLPYEPDA